MRGDLNLRRVLEELAAGDIGIEEALGLLPLLQIAEVERFARLDLGRRERKAVPEVIYAPSKDDEILAAIVNRFLTGKGLALVSRLEPDRLGPLEERVRREHPGVTLDHSRVNRTLEATLADYVLPQGGGKIGVLTAGTSDIPVAEEAALVAHHMGVGVERAFDVGVSGVHRLLEPLADMVRAEVDALIVVAGMEGALPSVVGGLVSVPVIGVPTSTGYGVGGDGTAALYAMLQTCSPGVVVVNVDNGVGAGAAAALIALRVSRSRTS